MRGTIIIIVVIILERWLLWTSETRLGYLDCILSVLDKCDPNVDYPNNYSLAC